MLEKSIRCDGTMITRLPSKCRSSQTHAEAMHPLMKTRHLQVLLPITLLTMALPCLAQDEAEDMEKAKQKMAEGVRKNLAAYDVVKGSLEAGPVTVRTRLGESVSDAGEGEVYDGIRFTAPKDLKGKDFVCYSNGPETWYDRGIVPVSGNFDDESSIWENSDCLYQDLDRVEEKDRQRIFYTLSGSFFKPGEDYLLWFRHGEGDAKPDSELRAVIAFVKRPENQSVLKMDSIEDALKLKRATAADQVKFLKSRGGRAMLDKDLFDPMDARESIDAVMAAIRTSTQSNSLLSGEIGVTCSSFKKLPKMADVISRHGAPDCVITPGERKRVRDHNRNARNDENDQNLVQHIYDYIVFETEEDDLDARVKRVRTHASFGQLKVPEKGSYRRSVNVSNLTLFYQDRKEVGRMYFFSGASEPLVIQEPPNGEYEDDKTSIYKYEGGGKWEWLSLKEGKVEMQIPCANNMMHGVGETFNENGKVIFRMPYVKGKLHGELIEMDEKGEVVSRRAFRNGQQMETKEGAKSRGKDK